MLSDMSLKWVRMFAGLTAVSVILACGGLGGADSAIEIFYVDHCKAAIGENVTIKGVHFGATQGNRGRVSVNGVPCTIVSWSATEIVATVPAGATSGDLVVINDEGADERYTGFEVGARTPVAEIEPNDAVDGSDATDVGMNESGTGTLASASDRDHFKFGCIQENPSYKIKVSPRVVGVVYVAGSPVTLDPNGEAILPPNIVGTALIGLTGATGAYTLSVTVVK